MTIARVINFRNSVNCLHAALNLEMVWRGPKVNEGRLSWVTGNLRSSDPHVKGLTYGKHLMSPLFFQHPFRP